MDTIRGFNGFAGKDQFNLLHEFRVAMNKNELKVVDIGMVPWFGTMAGMLVWGRVPVNERPNKGDPNYVNHMLSRHMPME